MSNALKKRYELNDKFNDEFIKSKNIVDNLPVALNDFENESAFKSNAAPFMTVWLLNINRLIKAGGISRPDFHFLDVGCGKGISTIYCADQFDFKTVRGFDFEAKLIEKAKININRAKLDKKIEVFVHDAALYTIPAEPHFLFMFNPFDGVVMRKFLQKNINILKSTNSLLGYANAHHLDVIREFRPRRIYEIPEYRSAVIWF